MRCSSRAVLPAALVLFGVAAGVVCGFVLKPERTAAQAAAETKQNVDEAEVHKALEAFVSAFNENDAGKLAATLTPTAEFIDDESNRVEGAKAIEGLLAKFFAANKGAKLQITPEGSRTVAPGVAIEDGESVVTVPDKETQSVRRFTIVLAKAEAGWKIASIREYPEAPEVEDSTDRLKDLEWFIGEWVDEGGDSLVTTTVKLSADKSHLIRDFSVKQQGKELLSGTQRITVDPLTETLKGWSYDSDGGYSESTWTKNGDSWLVRGTGVTSEGDVAAATYIIKALGKDRVEVKTMHKVVGDTIEADSTAILVRKPEIKK
jgi:uncharacterized protein (TIGR02246 family)